MLQIPDEIKELLHRDSCQKNIRIHFPNGERSDICNNLIVMDSVSFTESLCSQNTLKFGLCESPVFECEVVGVGNIKGATIEVNCEIYCDSSVTGAIWQNDLMAYVYQIPYGIFVVGDAKRQADMNHRKISAYSVYAYDINRTVNSTNNVGAFLTDEGHSSAGNFTISIEELLWTFYPRFFDKEKFTYDYWQLRESPSSAGLIYTKTVEGITYRIYRQDILMRGPSTMGSGPLYEINPKEYQERDITPDLEAAASAFASHGIFDESEMFELLSVNMPPIKFKVMRTDSPTSGTATIEEFPFYDKTVISSKNSYMYFGQFACLCKTRFYLERADGVVESWFPDVTISRLENNYPYYEISTTGYNLHNISLPMVKERRYANGIGNQYYYSARDAISKIDIIGLYSALLEAQGLFGRFNRDRDGITEINIKQQFGLLPANDQYPDEDLYPQGVTGGQLHPQDYQSCWYDDEYIAQFGAIQCKYTNTDSEDCVYTLTFNGDLPNYQTYMLDNNDYIKSFKWVQSDIETLCADLEDNIEGVTYMPVEFVGRGLPYVEAGDTFEILTASNDSITTIVLNRTVSGEQVLTDSYKSVS